MNNFQEHLARIQALKHFGADGALFYLFGKGFYYRQRHVGFQQRHTHFAYGAFNIFFRQLGLAGNAFKGIPQAVGKALKHRDDSYPDTKQPAVYPGKAQAPNSVPAGTNGFCRIR